MTMTDRTSSGRGITEDRSELPRAIGPRFPEILTTF
jgi:hypothetical protein